jgi:small-conductance mechanosensitive channel
VQEAAFRMSGVNQLWHFDFLGNELGAWGTALVIFLVTFTVLPIIRRFISVQRRRLRLKEREGAYAALNLAAALVEHTRPIFLWGLALWLGSRDLTFPPRIERGLTIVLVLLFWMQVAIWVMTAVRHGINLRRQRSAATPDALLSSSMEVILFAVGILIWGFAALLALDSLGIQVQPLLAGLGITGIALALAVQTVLGDLLASMSIAFDKPFALGDFLVIDDFAGRVEHIGVKSTRLRSINGEQIILGNADILKSRVRNFGRMAERRSLFVLDVHYETPVAALAAVPGAIREIIESTPNTRFDRCQLLRLTDKAVQFETVYFVTKPDFPVYAVAQQSINLRILERFRALEVTFLAVAPTPLRLQPRVTQVATDGSGQQRLL